MNADLQKLKDSFEKRNAVLDEIKGKLVEGLELVKASDIPPNTTAILEVMFLTHQSHLDDRQTQATITSALIEALVRMDARLTDIFKELDSLAAPVTPDESDAPA